MGWGTRAVGSGDGRAEREGDGWGKIQSRCPHLALALFAPGGDSAGASLFSALRQFHRASSSYLLFYIHASSATAPPSVLPSPVFLAAHRYV